MLTFVNVFELKATETPEMNGVIYDPFGKSGLKEIFNDSRGHLCNMTEKETTSIRYLETNPNTI